MDLYHRSFVASSMSIRSLSYSRRSEAVDHLSYSSLLLVVRNPNANMTILMRLSCVLADTPSVTSVGQWLIYMRIWLEHPILTRREHSPCFANCVKSHNLVMRVLIVAKPSIPAGNKLSVLQSRSGDTSRLTALGVRPLSRNDRFKSLGANVFLRTTRFSSFATKDEIHAGLSDPPRERHGHLNRISVKGQVFRGDEFGNHRKS